MESSDQAVEVSGQPPFKSPHIHFCGKKKDTKKKIPTLKLASGLYDGFASIAARLIVSWILLCVSQTPNNPAQHVTVDSACGPTVQSLPGTANRQRYIYKFFMKRQSLLI